MDLFSSLLLFVDPANDLIPVEDQPAAGPGAEVRKPSRNEGLPYGPGRTADESGHGANVQRCPKQRPGSPLHGKLCAAGVRRGWPRLAQNWPRLAGPRLGPAVAQGRSRKAAYLRGFARHSDPASVSG